MTVSRIAPTPSGPLHLGNAYNFLLTWLLVRRQGGKLFLRIDDYDAQRCRRAFVTDVFESLDWLGIDYDAGPQGVDDFYARYSSVLRRDHYRERMQRLLKNGEAYVCECSRSQIMQRFPGGVYRGFCRDRELAYAPMRAAVRLNVPEPCRIAVGQHSVDLSAVMGDFVLWRKEDLPAYQFASLIDDEALGVNLLVRGADLLDSSAAQRYLAQVMRIEPFLRAQLMHHPLLRGADGVKLSKSAGAYSLKQMREAGVKPEKVYSGFAEFFGLPESNVTTLDELLTIFDYDVP